MIWTGYSRTAKNQKSEGVRVKKRKSKAPPLQEPTAQGDHPSKCESFEYHFEAIRSLTAFYPFGTRIGDLAVILENDGKVSEGLSAAAVKRVHDPAQILV
jgi:hypothetical protein